MKGNQRVKMSFRPTLIGNWLMNRFFSTSWIGLETSGDKYRELRYREAEWLLKYVHIVDISFAYTFPMEIS